MLNLWFDRKWRAVKLSIIVGEMLGNGFLLFFREKFKIIIDISL